MVQRTSPARKRQLTAFGENIRRWRAVNRMSAAQLAERAAVSRETLRLIESGTGGRIDSLFAILAALGIAELAVDGIDPYKSPVARVRIDEILRNGGDL